ncbi:MAG TPA: LLM class flavin-dependent oxidoreductase [Bryobacteraceae bacterium]|nr:LLM class flavin-dependent oxidoreductase [Bryobacteraceae bacterium]
MQHAGLSVFTTCPPYRGSEPESYMRQIRDVSRWSDEAGCEGILVYTDNGALDPWLVSQIIIENTKALMPLVAVQPVYAHPYTIAKAVSTLSYLHGRRLCLNMVAGGFKNDLAALDDQTPHDRRYDRLVEYTTVIQKLLSSAAPVNFEGEFYRVQQLVLKPVLRREFSPLITVSGSSAEGLAAAHSLGAIPVIYPEPAERCDVHRQAGSGFGIRVGIIARDREDIAWEVAHQRFPPDRGGQMLHEMAMKVSDSVWHRQLSDLAQHTAPASSNYWLVPFQHYKTFCPYLVGTYAQVALEVARYVSAGCKLIILDVPESEEELIHVSRALSQASRQAAA